MRIENKLLFIFLILVIGCDTPVYTDNNHPNITEQFSELNNIKIASWNLQIFGDKKAANDTLMNRYVDIINDYDIIFIQEIRDEDSSAFYKLCYLLPEYNCEISSRAGSTSVKESYGLFYKRIELVSLIDYNPDDRWERPPLRADFNISNRIISIYNIHIDPDKVTNEVTYLESLSDNNEDIFLGDFNLDCSYFDESKLDYIFSNEFWNKLITDNQDTTVSSNDCTYDRIFATKDISVKNSGIREDITKDMSDHYLIWFEI